MHPSLCYCSVPALVPTQSAPERAIQPQTYLQSRHALQVDLPEPEDEAEPGGKKGGSVLNKRKEDKQLMELAGRTMNHAQR